MVASDESISMAERTSNATASSGTAKQSLNENEPSKTNSLSKNVSFETSSRATASGNNDVKPKQRIQTQNQPRVVEKATKVNMGKIEPCRDFGFPLLCFIVAFVFCYQIGDIGTSSTSSGSSTDEPAKKKEEWTETFQSLMARKAKLAFDRRGGATALNCSLFYAQSNIPGAGFSLFAGRDYDTGDIVFEEGDDFLPTTTTTTMSTDQEEAEKDTVFIRRPAYLLKYHHLASNLEGTSFAMAKSAEELRTDGNFDLRASRPIKAGDELLLVPHQHPRSLVQQGLLRHQFFNDIPSPEDYELANGIIADTRERTKVKGRENKLDDIGMYHCYWDYSVVHRCSFLSLSNLPYILYHPVTTKEAMLKLVYRTTRKFNERVANMLPQSKIELKSWFENRKKNKDFSLAVLKTATKKGLEMNAKCLSYVQTSNTESVGLVPTRQFHQDSTIIPVPLLVVPLSSSRDESCQPHDDVAQCTVSIRKEFSRCLSHKNLPFMLCPLSQANQLTIANVNQTANVAFKWSTGNSANKNAHGISASQVKELYTTQLSFDLVALREIHGEPLVIQLNTSLDGTLSIPNDLIPDAWRGVPE